MPNLHNMSFSNTCFCTTLNTLPLARKHIQDDLPNSAYPYTNVCSIYQVFICVEGEFATSPINIAEQTRFLSLITCGVWLRSVLMHKLDQIALLPLPNTRGS